MKVVCVVMHCAEVLTATISVEVVGVSEATMDVVSSLLGKEVRNDESVFKRFKLVSSFTRCFLCSGDAISGNRSMK